MNVFPFTLPRRDGDRLFERYVRANRERLHAELGEWCLTTVNGKTGDYKLWSWYEVDVEVHSETTVVFTTYSMDDMRSGGRGELQDVIPHAYALIEPLREAIAERKQALARQVYRARQEEAERAGVAAVHKELFGE